LLNSISVADQDFQKLAVDRAKAVREYLLQSGKVEAERLFLTEAKAGSMKTEGPRVYLQLQ
jgi:flagellar motor protein MotB